MPLAYKTLCFEPIQGLKFRNSIIVLALQKAGEISRKRCVAETSNGSLVQKIQTKGTINPLNAELNPICHLLALLGAHHILHVSRIRVKIKFGTQIPVYTELYLQKVTAIGALKNGSEILILNQKYFLTAEVAKMDF